MVIDFNQKTMDVLLEHCKKNNISVKRFINIVMNREAEKINQSYKEDNHAQHRTTR